MNEIENLIQRMLDGELSSSERQQLATILKSDPEARAFYSQQCQIHAELLMNEELRITLPFAPPIDEENEIETPSELNPKRKIPWLPYVSMVAASVAISVSAIIAYQNFGSKRSHLTGEPPQAALHSASPQEIYNQTLFSESGSLQRPPTPFVNVSAEQGKTRVSFNHDIRPILSENCYACHGPDSEARKADLRLDIEEWAFRKRKDGPPAIIRGDPKNSPLYQRITNPLKSDIMPPTDSHKSLTEVQKKLIGRWIAEGAEWQGHWSFIKPKKQEPPTVPWGNNAIDKFIFVVMKAKGLTPNDEADRPTLARRLSLDLTGLPPTPEMVERFARDGSANAYENLVDKLLGSSAYGEHQARYWLDAARYADTHGLHLDNYREIWPYRDWVIKAFNENMPFDKFTVEQMAGDLLPNATLEQRLATGFNRCNPTSSEGGAIDEEYRAIYAKNRVETTATVFMGLTIGCASCHDHKFDPWTQKDFYQFSAFFNNLNGPIMDKNAYDTAPIVVMPKKEYAEDWTRVETELEEMNKALKQIKVNKQTEFDTWLASDGTTFTKDSISKNIQLELIVESLKPDLAEPDEEELEPEELSGYSKLNVRMGESISLSKVGSLFNPDQAFTLSCSVKLPTEGGIKDDRIPILEQFDGNRGWRLSMANSDKTFPKRYQFTFELIHSLKDNQLISITAKSDRINPREGSTTSLYITYDGSGKAQGIELTTGSRQLFNFAKLVDNLNGPVSVTEDLAIGVSHDGDKFGDFAGAETQGSIKSVQFFDRPIYPFEVSATGQLANLKKTILVEKDRRRERDAGQLENYYFSIVDPDYRKLKFAQAVQEMEYNFIYDQATVSLVMEDTKKPASAFMLARGQYDKPGEEVFPDVPKALGGLPEGLPKNRLGLARWLVDPGNPLTARVTVNRFWQNLFGTGLVATSEDFGIMGENPSHPELLDWLAIRFQESGWDVKGLINLMVTSATYRQDSSISPEKLAVDRNNRYLARGPRYRLDGEVLRDQALFVSDSLNPTIGGPPVKPYQPEGIWNAVAYTDSNTAFFSQDHGDALYRRSLYTFWKRTAPPPNMVVFDVPSRETCNVRRERTNTPLQALTLMNDPQFVEAARHLAERSMLDQKDSSSEKIDRMYTYAFGNQPAKKHHEVLKRSYEKFLSAFTANPEDAEKLIQAGDSLPDSKLDPVELASLTMVANQIMNLDSFINKY